MIECQFLKAIFCLGPVCDPTLLGQRLNDLSDLSEYRIHNSSEVAWLDQLGRVFLMEITCVIYKKLDFKAFLIKLIFHLVKSLVRGQLPCTDQFYILLGYVFG